MFEPLRELLLAFQDGGRATLSGHAALGTVVLEERRLLGEKDGRLYGSSEAAEYAARGGATYPQERLVNEAVVGWDLSEEDSPLDRWRQRRRGQRPWGGWELVLYLCAVCAAVLRGVARVVLCTAAYILPALRIIFPWAVPRPGRGRHLLAATSSSAPERVTAIAFHPYQMVLALAVDEGGADRGTRIVVYDAALEKVVVVLTHAFQRDVQALAWKPWSGDVLAAGCRGGVLLWSVSGGPGSPQEHSAKGFGAREAVGAAGEAAHTRAGLKVREPIGAQAAAAAFALFYRCSRGLPVTTLGFSNENGRYLASGSRHTARLHVLDLSCGPQEPGSVLCSLVPSMDGGSEQVIFSDDDSFVLSATSGASSLSFVRVNQFPYTTTTVPTPAPVVQVASASGIGPNYFFLYTKSLEGVLVARMNGLIGVEVVSLISTGICRGVGGAVRCIAASRRRLWIVLETGHLLICYYHRCDGHIHFIPVGVAATDAYLLASFPGCQTGSLLGLVERDGTLSFIPSYHI